MGVKSQPGGPGNHRLLWCPRPPKAGTGSHPGPLGGQGRVPDVAHRKVQTVVLKTNSINLLANSTVPVRERSTQSGGNGSRPGKDSPTQGPRTTRAAERPLQGALDGLGWRRACLRRPSAAWTGPAGREVAPQRRPGGGVAPWPAPFLRDTGPEPRTCVFVRPPPPQPCVLCPCWSPGRDAGTV